MFVIEIGFKDGVSQPETIFVRRPQALIGGSDFAHVVIDDMKALNYQLRLVRDLGRRFRCKPIGSDPNVQVPDLLEGIYEGEASLDLGPIKFHVTAIDCDLLLKETEPPDRAGVRVLRQACATHGPLFPAVVVLGASPMVISFVPDQPLYIGRSKHCALRLDSSDISAKHARMGYESGEFWIEDLGSTNGTFVNQQQVAGRVNVPAGMPILLGREVSVLGVTAEDQIVRATKSPSDRAKKAPAQERRYPVILSVWDLARPARLVIPLGASVNIGRDQGSDMWLGAPHISRRHCSISLTKTGSLSVIDHSTNGTSWDGGILKRGDVLDVQGAPKVLDFGGGVTVALCFDEEQENMFIASQGSPNVFKQQQPVVDAGSGPRGRERRPSRIPTGAGAGMKLDVPVKPGLAGRFGEFYRFLSPAKKVFFLLSVIGFVVFVIIIFNLVSGVIS